MPVLEEAKQAKSLHKSAILNRPNVVGVGVGYKMVGEDKTDELSIIALVREKIPIAGLLPEALVPSELDGIRTDVMEVGDLRPLTLRTDRWRPAPPGVSIGHYKVTAGTFGAVVRDKSSGRRLILSNNHVIANSNESEIGDPILQPGVVDGGRIEQDTIAHLENYCKIDFGLSPPTCSYAELYTDFGNKIASMMGSGHRLQVMKTNPSATNLVDAAVARPVEDSMISDDILEIGEVVGTKPASLAMLVQKSGRTTGLRTGEILVLDTTIEIEYGAGRSASFEQQILTSPISQGGDSGSLLVTADSAHAVGLLFAGSNQATLHNPIQAVIDCLNIDFVSQSVISKKLEKQSALDRAQAVKDKHKDALLRKANVLGVGLGLSRKNGQRTGTTAIIVTVKQKLPPEMLSPADLIPTEIEGVPVDVIEVGEIKAH
jgi:hypothetical protein